MTTTAGRTYRPPFDPRAAYVAARDLNWGTPDGEIKIPSGAPFDRADLGCDDWMARRLYRTRLIAMVLDGGTPVAPVSQASQVTSPPPAPPAPAARLAERQPDPDDDDDDDPAEPTVPDEPPEPAEPDLPPWEEDPPAARKLEVKSRGFGRFIVIDEQGKRVYPPEGRWLTKREAEAFAQA